MSNLDIKMERSTLNLSIFESVKTLIIMSYDEEHNFPSPKERDRRL